MKASDVKKPVPIKANCYERFIIKYPVAMMIISFLAPLVLGALAFNAGLERSDGSAGWSARSDPFQEQLDAIKQGKTLAQQQLSAGAPPVSLRDREGPGNQFLVVYEAADGNMMSVANIKIMREMEKRILTKTEVGSDRCQLLYLNSAATEGKCRAPRSILNYFYNDPTKHQTACGEGYCDFSSAASAAGQEAYDASLSGNNNPSEADLQAAVGAYKTAQSNYDPSTINCPTGDPANPGPFALGQTPGLWGDMPCRATSVDGAYSASASLSSDWQKDLRGLLVAAGDSQCSVTVAGDGYRSIKRQERISMFSNDFECPSLRAKYAKSVFYLGNMPNSDDSAADEEDKGSRKYFQNYFETLYDEVMAFNEELGTGSTDSKVRVYFYDVKNAYNNVVMNRAINEDMIWIVGSILFVFFYVWGTLGSLFLAICGLWEILMSMPLAFFCWRVLGQQKFYGTLQLLGLFIILGIGADDVFVLTDAWKQSKHAEPHISGSVETRFPWAFRRARNAMTVTSATTFFAFVSSAITPIPSMLSFGVFAALLVLFDFFLVISWYPACLIFHDRYLLPRVRGFCGCIPCCDCLTSRWPVCCGRSDVKVKDKMVELQRMSKSSKTRSNSNTPPSANNSDSGSSGGGADGDTDSEKPEPVKEIKVPMTAAPPGVAGTAEVGHGFDRSPNQLRAIEKFFYFKFYGFMTKKKVRYGILGAFACVFLATACITGVYLRPSKEQSEMFGPDHPLTRVREVIAEDFTSGSESQKVSLEIVWGIPMTGEAIDRTGLDMQSTELGKPIFDKDFEGEIKTAAMQEQILEMCEKGKNAGDDMVARSNSQPEYYCFMQVVKEYLEANARTWPPGPDLASVLNEAAFLQFYGDEGYLGFGKSTGVVWANSAKTEISMAWVGFNTTLPPRSMSLAVSESWYERWEEVIDTVVGGSDNKIQSCRMWGWMVTQRYLVNSAIYGVIISLGLALGVLLIATMNWIISVLAFVNIIGVTCAVFATMVAAGWSIGILEAICMIIIVGMSIDYTVHLIHSYTNSTSPDRNSKNRHALTEMGISVVGGALTTFGASVFLFGSKMTFFFQFGVFIAMAIAFSTIYAFLPLQAMLFTFGPQGVRGVGSGLTGDLCCVRRKTTESNQEA